MKARNTRKTRKIRHTRKTEKTPVLFHFFDDQPWNFEGVAISPDGSHIEHMMCSGNIVCHKVNNRNDIGYTLKDVETLLQRYISNISNPSIRKYITFDQMINYNSIAGDKKIPLYHPDRGVTADDIAPLCDPALRRVIVGFDMDDTLHQVGGIINVPNKELIKELSTLTGSTITYNDIGEMYFGGKERLAHFKTMFQNLARTIGMENVYIITSNPSHQLLEIIPDLYSRLFGVKFSEKNVKVARHGEQTKFNIIRSILAER